MPEGNYICINDENIIDNAIKYFEKVRYSLYILFNTGTSNKTPVPKTNDDYVLISGGTKKKNTKIFKEKHRVENENIKQHIRVTRNQKSVVIKSSRKILRIRLQTELKIKNKKR